MATFLAHGEIFSPAQAEQTYAVAFDEKQEPGAIGVKGRYRGVPTPYGAAQKSWATDAVCFVEPGQPFLDLLQRLAEASRFAGATCVTLDFMVNFQDQCNFEFSPAFAAGVARADVTVTISCYQVESL